MAFRACESLGREYKKRMAIHQAFIGEVWQVWTWAQTRDPKYKDVLMELVENLHTPLRKDNSKWVVNHFHLLKPLAKYCPWLQLYVFELKFTIINGAMNAGPKRDLPYGDVYEETMA